MDIDMFIESLKTTPSERKAIWYEENRKRILNIKILSNGCAYCGWDLHKEILQFHHRNPKRKKTEITGSFLQRKNFKIIKKEIDKCDLLCPNCHFWKHYIEKRKY